MEIRILVSAPPTAGVFPPAPSTFTYKGDAVVIKNFSDHSANERTYLAWIRTAIAVMVFGFVIEKFNIFRLSLTQELGKPLPSLPTASGYDAQLLGVGLVILGIGMIMVATVRFIHFKRQIDNVTQQTSASALAEVLLALLLSLLGLFLLMYLSHLLRGYW